MARAKKVVILYATAGHGHEKAARSLLEAVRELDEKAEVEAINTLLLTRSFFGAFYRQFYYFQIRHTPWLWGLFYGVLDIGWFYSLTAWVRRLVNSLMAKPLEHFLLKENPSVIVSTHFLSTEVAGYLKTKGRIRSKIVTVVTDYLPHCIWTAPGVDLYVVALEETKAELAKRGVAEERIRVLGIPVEKKFLARHSREETRSRLGLAKDKFTVLVTSGGVGIGSIESIAEGLLTLRKPIQILAVCGTNRKMFDHLSLISKEYPLLKVFGFVTNMNELMEASDLVVGKAGGLTVTESFVKGKPMIFFRSVPGQETRNAVCAARHGAGAIVNAVEEVILKTLEFLDDPVKLEGMRKSVAKVARPHASRDIARLAMELAR